MVGQGEGITEKAGRTRSYEGLADLLRGKVRRGEWGAGAMLPSRVSLSRDYGVSATTVQQAIAQLIGEGLLYADEGRGTFVAAAADAAPRPNGLAAGNGPAPSNLGQDAAVAGRAAIPRGLVFGILDSNALISGDAVRADGYGWVDAIATQMESAFDQVEGHSRWFAPPSSAAASLETALDALLAQNIDALAIISIFDELDYGEGALARIGTMPCVYISWNAASAAIPHIYYDNRVAGYFSLQHLAKQGYSRFAFVSMDAQPWSEERLEGMRACRSMPVASQLILSKADWIDERARFAALDRWVEETVESAPPGETGIVAGNDWMAMHLMDAARKRGLRPGPDYGIVGFDNHPESRAYGLTTLRPPLEALGAQAAEMLFNQIRGDRTQIEARLRSQMLARASTRR